MTKSSEQAYRKIRTAILTGHFPPGRFVPEDEFAEYCNMSRTPVREAIGQLTAEMLLQRTDTNRVFVPKWSDDDAEELFALRVRLETYAAEQAARHISAAQISALKDHCAYIEEAIRGNSGMSVPGFVEGNRRFHAVIQQAAQSDRLNQLMKLVVSQVVIHRTAERYDFEDMLRSQNDHNDLVSALERGDVEWASTIANNHIRRAANTYRQYREGDNKDRV